ncbi:hypothetical protein ACS0TY_015954 [Phlomoides rotata]
MEQLIQMTGSEDDELMKELFDVDLSPFFMHPIPSADSHSQFLSAAYSGPTIQEIETALSYTNYGVHDFHQEADVERISRMERSYLNKLTNDINKYTLKIKNFGSVMADDGYKWRKYGQKSIKNSPNPRSYYRCTNSRCAAKKQVERSIEDPDTLIITYEGLHLHYIYPIYLLDQHQPDPPIKKQKGPILEAQHKAHDIGGPTENGLDLGPLASPIKEFGQDLMAQEGLLEDVVPLMIRKPLIDSTSSNTSSSASHDRSHPSSPISSNSFSWSPSYSCLGLI